MPLGGIEANSGYKGYGLAMLVEVLGGVLGNANYGRKIRTWQSPLKNTEQQADGANLGQAFIVIDPSVFGGGFPLRMDDFIEQMHSLPPGEGQPGVMVPGEPELNAHKE